MYTKPVLAALICAAVAFPAFAQEDSDPSAAYRPHHDVPVIANEIAPNTAQESFQVGNVTPAKPKLSLTRGVSAPVEVTPITSWLLNVNGSVGKYHVYIIASDHIFRAVRREQRALAVQRLNGKLAIKVKPIRKDYADIENYSTRPEDIACLRVTTPDGKDAVYSSLISAASFSRAKTVVNHFAHTVEGEVSFVFKQSLANNSTDKDITVVFYTGSTPTIEIKAPSKGFFIRGKIRGTRKSPAVASLNVD